MAHRPASDALYLSGVTLTTVGFGDVVASVDALRMVTIAEAASGFAVITGAISYLISVYPQVSVVRTAASRLTDSGVDSPDGAARLVIHGGSRELASLHTDLIAVHQNLRRFPVLYYFHAERGEASIHALFRAAALVAALLRWGVRPGAREYVDFYARAMPATVDRIMEDMARDFVGGSGGSLQAREEWLADPRAVAARRRVLCQSVAAIAPDLAAGDAPDEDLATFVGRAERFLAALADRHGFSHRPLLESSTDQREGEPAPGP